MFEIVCMKKSVRSVGSDGSELRRVVLAVVVVLICVAGMGSALGAEGKAPDPAAAAKPATPSGMFVSMRDVYLGENVFPTEIEGLRRLGVDAIEVSLGKDFAVRAVDSNEKVFLRTNEDAAAFRQRVEKLGVRICSMLTACDFSAGDAESNIAYVARAIEIADLLGASAVRIDSAMSKERELDFETRVKLFVDGLSGALQRTASSKVALGIENHGFQGNNPVFLLNVFEQVGSERLGMTLDAGNFYWRGYPLSEVYGIVRLLAPYTKHTHMKNIHYPEDKRETMREVGWEYARYSCPLDEGDVDWAKVVGILAKAGYKGDLCIEDESVEKCKTPAERAAVTERNVALVRHVLEGLPK